MQDLNISRHEDETLEQCLWRLGTLKKSGKVGITWNHITDFLNDEFDLYYGESSYRKKFKQMCRALAVKEIEAVYDNEYTAATRNRLRELEKQRVRIGEERALYKSDLKTEAQRDALVQELKEAIVRANPVSIEIDENVDGEHALYAMLSDIHYGLSFSSYYDSYSPEIAEARVAAYAQRLCQIGKAHNIGTIYVSILGDLISGSIHQSVRLENRKNVIAQVIGVSELISDFLHCLAEHFGKVIVTDVAGNHSRLDANVDNALRTERLDMLIPWYCKAKLENVENIVFSESEVDATISVQEIFGKTYVAVHGDFDHDMKTSALRIANLIGKKVDYFFAGHMHVADMRIEDTGYIRNGAVVSGGDEYTSKKRLFGPATQVCLLLSADGVDAVYPIKL